MPILEFGCPKCRRKFEEIFPPARTPASAKCPRCGETSKRVPSRFAVAGTSHKSESDDFDADMGGDESFDSAPDDGAGDGGDDDFD